MSTWLELLLWICAGAMPILFFWRGCGCCPSSTDCVGSSTFDTLNGFTQAAGFWSISSGRAAISSPLTHGCLIWDRANPAGASDPVIASTYVNAASIGGKARLAVSVVDASNYVALEVQFGGGGICGAARVIRRSGGSETVIGADVPLSFATTPNQVVLLLTYDPTTGEMICRVTYAFTNVMTFVRTVTSTGGTKGAIATAPGATSTYYFDNFTYECGGDLGCTISLNGAACEFESIGSNRYVSYSQNWRTTNIYTIRVTSSSGVIFDYVDSSNFHYVTGMLVGMDLHWQLFKKTGGADTLICDFGTLDGTSGDCVLHVNNGYVAMTPNDGSETYGAAETTLHGGTRAGYINSTATVTEWSFKHAKACGTEGDCEVFARCYQGVTPWSLQGKAPFEWQVEISGLTGTHGLLWNGTYILRPIHGGGETCIWRSADAFVTAYVQPITGLFYITVGTIDPGPHFSHTFTTPEQCDSTSISGEVCDLETAEPDFASATCTLTALMC